MPAAGEDYSWPEAEEGNTSSKSRLNMKRIESGSKQLASTGIGSMSKKRLSPNRKKLSEQLGGSFKAATVTGLTQSP